MYVEFSAVCRKVAQGSVGYVDRLPGANAQGTTLEEVRAHLAEAALLVMEANRKLASIDQEHPNLIREPLRGGH